MSNKEITNYAHSVRMRLLNVSNKTGQTFQRILPRYFQERLLYRLSQSAYRDNFVLKGGALLYAYDRFQARPTLDIDFLGNRISRDIEHIKKVFSHVVNEVCIEDGVIFDADTLSAEEITVNKEYHGVRLQVTAHLDSVRQPISMDIGFGDIVTPCPQSLDFPTLLTDLPEANILAYSLETVVAEKFEAMISLSTENSRMKDFFDLYRILTSQKTDEVTLWNAIKTTFENRQTPLQEKHPLFEPSFFADTNRVAFWNGFLRKIKWKEDIDFKKVGAVISKQLKGFYENLCTQ